MSKKDAVNPSVGAQRRRPCRQMPSNSSIQSVFNTVAIGYLSKKDAVNPSVGAQRRHPCRLMPSNSSTQSVSECGTIDCVIEKLKQLSKF
ncbi:hypothetical protein QWZ13_09730 [Reinekea marina]|uniref:hypothetical protein n=1 Tax=Reinekea marina TaxID=1310421 RepID=UPI0025B52BC7|nr:hypothetical protein [Reinekea marina]MDN3649190.1 hypothetical protein [Reinekea marina]